MIKIKIHSIVDVITNSSTVIYTYQNSIKEAKELVQEVLDIAGITDKTPDDIFYYGIFCDKDRYFEAEHEDFPKDCPEIDYSTPYNSEERRAIYAAQDKWLGDIKLSIMKGEIEKPNWMVDAEEEDYDGWSPDSYLYLVPKDNKFKGLADKISKLLGSVSADGGRDG